MPVAPVDGPATLEETRRLLRFHMTVLARLASNLNAYVIQGALGVHDMNGAIAGKLVREGLAHLVEESE